MRCGPPTIKKSLHTSQQMTEKLTNKSKVAVMLSEKSLFNLKRVQTRSAKNSIVPVMYRFLVLVELHVDSLNIALL